VDEFNAAFTPIFVELGSLWEEWEQVQDKILRLGLEVFGAEEFTGGEDVAVGEFSGFKDHGQVSGGCDGERGYGSLCGVALWLLGFGLLGFGQGRFGFDGFFVGSSNSFNFALTTYKLDLADTTVLG